MKHASRAVLMGLLLGVPVLGGDLERGDPKNVPSPPSDAIGFPSRDADLDVLPGFITPPAGYGEVAFYWWLGDPLTRERLQWQIDQLAGKGVSGLQVNYAHSDHGGRSWGLTLPSDPPLFSEPWWDLVRWFLKSARKQGMAISLSDYTLGFGQGWYVDELLRERPDLRGATLEHLARPVEGELIWELPENTLVVTAYRVRGGRVVPGSGLDLRDRVAGARLAWTAPAGAGPWSVHVVRFQVAPWSLDPMHPESGPRIVERFFQRFEDRNPGESGQGLNFFFSDELGFGVEGRLWTARFAADFQERKGYDIVPELPALFVDVGPRTPKVRLDYSDVMVALSEEGFFRPIFEWHQRRGMIYGCDHGGRGRKVTEFGDYFRTQRWNQGPGADQPRLGKDVIKAKVAASIAHLYERPRVWIEGYYGSGWGTTSAEVADATFANFAMGFNLLTLHGLYYSTHGGWWEWAPPCNHFHMPYWTHMGELLHCTERLSYVLSQGHHRADVAIMYPVAPMEAGMDGAASVESAFALGEHLYRQGIDFDFMDFESLARAETREGELRVSGEVYRVLVLPSMRAARHSTLRQAVELQRAGGLVVVLGASPEASDRRGRADPEVARLVAELEARAADPAELASLIEAAGEGDYRGPGFVQHRRIGPRDVYMIYGGSRGAEAAFRATGRVDLWDPWTGRTRPLPILSQTATATTLHLPLTEEEPQLIVFGPGEPVLATTGADGVPTQSMPLDGPWAFELEPALDNRWGDYHWPPTSARIGAEMRRPRHAPEAEPNPGWERPSFDDTSWPRVTTSYGPRFWKLGPLPQDLDPTALEARLVKIAHVDPSVPVDRDGRSDSWQPYEFSWRWGIEGDPGHQGYHGLKARVSDDFIALGTMTYPSSALTDPRYEKEPGGTRYYLWTTVLSDRDQPARLRMGGLRPTAVWLDGARLEAGELGEVMLREGAHPLLLRFDSVGRGHVVVETGPVEAVHPPREPPEDPTSERVAVQPVFEPSDLAMTWHDDPDVLPFDLKPQAEHPAGWYRFTSPPGLRALTVPAGGEVRAWADGVELEVAGRGRFGVREPSAEPVTVALRIAQERGDYGGAALHDPIRLDCGPGTFVPGDWSENDGLASYSGGAWYRRRATLTAEQARGHVVLDLGRVVASAEVWINGQRAGTRVAPPWTVDVSPYVEPGENRIEVLVYNTLANHYSTIPTRYRGSPESGLLGPVSLEFTPLTPP